MTMEILPAIDLRGGRVVRLERGDYGRQTTYGADPAAVARQFVQAGARWIHVVDLDAARGGGRVNAGAGEPWVAAKEIIPGSEALAIRRPRESSSDSRAKRLSQ